MGPAIKSTERHAHAIVPKPFAGEVNFIEIINSVMGYDSVAGDSDTHK
jgi:hypothetical protein